MLNDVVGGEEDVKLHIALKSLAVVRHQLQCSSMSQAAAFYLDIALAFVKGVINADDCSKAGSRVEDINALVNFIK